MLISLWTGTGLRDKAPIDLHEEKSREAQKAETR